MNYSRKTYAILGLFLFVIVSTPIRIKKPVDLLAGTAVLQFNGDSVANTQIDLTEFVGEPVLVCSASNEWVAGAMVACQALGNGYGSVSAQLPYTTTMSLEINWIAKGQ